MIKDEFPREVVMLVGTIEVEANSDTIALPIIFEVLFGVHVGIGPIHNALSTALHDGAFDPIVGTVRYFRRCQLLHIADCLRVAAEYALIVIGADKKEQLGVVFAHE